MQWRQSAGWLALSICVLKRQCVVHEHQVAQAHIGKCFLASNSKQKLAKVKF